MAASKRPTPQRSQPLFAEMKCVPCDGGTPRMSHAAIAKGLKQIPGWTCRHGAIRKTFRFKNYYETMAFVNATAWLSHRADHHPDLLVHYNHCEVAYFTHAIQGISDNDFICAAKIEKLFNL